MLHSPKSLMWQIIVYPIRDIHAIRVIDAVRIFTLYEEFIHPDCVDAFVE